MTELASISLVLKGEFSEEEKTYGESYLRDLIEPTAKRIYRQDVEIIISSEDGSLKVTLVFLGVLYTTIAGYGSFRAGLDQLGKDAQFLSSLIETDIKKNGFPEDNIVSVKKNTRFSSKLSRLMTRVEKLDNLKNTEIDKKREIELVIRNINKLLAEATNEADRMLVVLAIEEVDNQEIFIKKNPNKPERPEINNKMYFVRKSEYDGDNVLLDRIKYTSNEKLLKLLDDKKSDEGFLIPFNSNNKLTNQ